MLAMRRPRPSTGVTLTRTVLQILAVVRVLVTVAGAVRRAAGPPVGHPSRLTVTGSAASVFLVAASRLTGLHPNGMPLPDGVMVLGTLVTLVAALVGGRENAVLRARGGSIGLVLLSLGLLWGLMGLPAA